MEDMPRISAVVLHFNNGEYLYETLASILCQDYPNIELLISDDCSLGGFDVDRVIQFINSNRRNNLKRTVININQTNLGTVKNLETIRAKETGEFELLIAGDDVWYDETIFSSFARRFEELGSEVEWIISQTEMRDEKLEEIHELFVKPEAIELIEKKAFKDLLSLCVTTVCLPSAGVAYRRTFFEKINHLSKYYYLVEDYPTHLRALRSGIQVFYLDKVAVIHRSGGVSHGNKRNSSRIFSLYIQDLIAIFEKEILPYKELYSLDAYECAIDRYAWFLKQYRPQVNKKTQQGEKPTKLSELNQIFARFFIALKPRLGLLIQKGKIKNDFLLLAELLACLSFLRMGSSLFFTESVTVPVISIIIYLFAAIAFSRILLFLAVKIISKLV